MAEYGLVAGVIGLYLIVGCALLSVALYFTVYRRLLRWMRRTEWLSWLS